MTVDCLSDNKQSHSLESFPGGPAGVWPLAMPRAFRRGDREAPSTSPRVSFCSSRRGRSFSS